MATFAAQPALDQRAALAAAFHFASQSKFRTWASGHGEFPKTSRSIIFVTREQADTLYP
jgi:hypothetical protein